MTVGVVVVRFGRFASIVPDLVKVLSLPESESMPLHGDDDWNAAYAGSGKDESRFAEARKRGERADT